MKKIRMGIVAIIGLALLGCEEKVVVKVVEKPIYIDTPVYIDKTFVEPVLFETQKNEIQEEVTLVMSCNTAGAAIYYTIDGNDPTTESNKYEGDKLIFSQDTTIKAFATKAGMESSSVSQIGIAISTKEILISYVAPVSFNQQKDDVRGTVTVTMTCATEGAAIYYTTDGRDPTIESDRYEEGTPLIFKENGTLKAFAAKEDMGNSALSQVGILISVKEISASYVESVHFVQQKDEAQGVVVTMSCPTEGAAIYYTTDGRDPTIESLEYVDKILTFEQDTTIKAFAVKEGMEDSPISQIDISISVKEPVIPTGTSYTVKHMKQKEDGSSYEVSETEFNRQFDEGIAMSAIARTYEGFTASAMNVVGETVNILYTRKLITYTFYCDVYTTFDDGSTMKRVCGLYGAPVADLPQPPVSVEDYYSDGWLTQDGSPCGNFDRFDLDKDQAEFFVNWKRYTRVTYRLTDMCDCGKHGYLKPVFVGSEKNTFVYKGRPGSTLPDKPNIQGGQYYTKPEWYSKPDKYPEEDLTIPVYWDIY